MWGGHIIQDCRGQWLAVSLCSNHHCKNCVFGKFPAVRAVALCRSSSLCNWAVSVVGGATHRRSCQCAVGGGANRRGSPGLARPPPWVAPATGVAPVAAARRAESW